MSHVRQKEKENRHLNMDKNGSSNLWNKFPDLLLTFFVFIILWIKVCPLMPVCNTDEF